MYIAMNRFKVDKASTEDFEQIWLERKSTLHELDGFVEFHMLRGPEHEDHVLYASHTVWRSKANFEAWTKSQQFRDAHARPNTSGKKSGIQGHPNFEGFEVFQHITNPQLVAAE